MKYNVQHGDVGSWMLLCVCNGDDSPCLIPLKPSIKTLAGGIRQPCWTWVWVMFHSPYIKAISPLSNTSHYHEMCMCDNGVYNLSVVQMDDADPKWNIMCNMVVWVRECSCGCVMGTTGYVCLGSSLQSRHWRMEYVIRERHGRESCSILHISRLFILCLQPLQWNVHVWQSRL